MKPGKIVALALFSLFVSCLIDGNAQDANPDYDQVAAQIFWQELYGTGGWTLYCGYRFDKDRKTKSGRLIGIEHIYPGDLMLKRAGCKSRLQCYQSDNTMFRLMEADMHNMYPVWQNLITYRYNYSYGVVTGEEWRVDGCDIEWKSGVLEPRAVARGNIARAVFYMHNRYGVEIDPKMFQTLKEWNREDPPSKQERERNDRIELLQGRRNPYIDQPMAIEKLSLREKANP